MDTEQNALVEIDNTTELFEYIARLPANYAVTPNRYLDLEDGNDLLMQIDMVADRIRGQFAVKRRTKLPPVEAGGQYRPLELDAEEGLAEIFHFVYFPDTNIMGTEFNYFAPRVNRMHDYLTEKASALVNMVQFTPKLAGSVRETLRRVGRMTLFKIGVYKEQIDILEEYNGDLHRALETLRDLDNNARELEVILKLGTRKKDEDLNRTLLDRLPDFLNNIINRQAISNLQARAYDERIGRTVLVDLLEDKLVALRQVVALDEDSRAIMSDSMYAGIEDAYIELRDSLI